MLTTAQIAFMHTVADRCDADVLAHASGGQWMPGVGDSVDTWSTLRTIEDGHEFHIGTAIDKRDQRVMVCAQPVIATSVTSAVRAATVDTPDEIATPLLLWCRQVNTAARLRVPEPVTVS